MTHNHNNLIQLTQDLIQRRSITPEDDGCQALLTALLRDHGFEVETWVEQGVSNLVASIGSGHPCLLLLGHTDVVPTGDESHWQHPPFDAHIDDDNTLHGRGACDMKSSVAAMVTAATDLDRPERGTLMIALTSDEEGPAVNGSRSIAAKLRERGVALDAVLVGEPSSDQQLGDTVRIGRRGSLTLHCTIQGKQGHVAYPHLADNAIHAFGRLVGAMESTGWPAGGHAFPNTSWQWVEAEAGVAGNVIPGVMNARLNFRYPATTDTEQLMQLFEDCLASAEVDCNYSHTLHAEPFFSEPGPLRTCLQEQVEQCAGITPTFDTGGGTSDGRFFADWVPEVLELGPLRATIHAVDEHIDLTDLERLYEIYRGVIEGFLR